MKKYFPGFYPADLKKIDWINDKLTIILDTDVLLDLFRMPTDVANIFLGMLEDERVKLHLWLPYDVAWLYHYNVNKEILSQIDNINSALSHLMLCKQSIDAKRAYPYLRIETWNNLSACIKKIQSECSIERDLLKKSLRQCSIKYKIGEIFADVETKIGCPYDEAQLDIIYNEGEKRYKDSMPPSPTFDQISNKRIRHHNLIVWKQILAKAMEMTEKSERCHFVFVTGLITDNWYYIVGEKNISTRHELQNEFCGKINSVRLTYEPFFVCCSSLWFIKELSRVLGVENTKSEKLIKHLEEKAEVYSTPINGIANNQTIINNNLI